MLDITAAAPDDAPLRMPRGSTLVMYTDGLIGRRGTTTRDEPRRLRGFVERERFPDTTARHVVEQMLGESPTQHDIVVVCLSRTTPASWRVTDSAW